MPLLEDIWCRCGRIYNAVAGGYTMPLWANTWCRCGRIYNAVVGGYTMPLWADILWHCGRIYNAIVRGYIMPLWEVHNAVVGGILTLAGARRYSCTEGRIHLHLHVSWRLRLVHQRLKHEHNNPSRLHGNRSHNPIKMLGNFSCNEVAHFSREVWTIPNGAHK